MNAPRVLGALVLLLPALVGGCAMLDEVHGQSLMQALPALDKAARAWSTDAELVLVLARERPVWESDPQDSGNGGNGGGGGGSAQMERPVDFFAMVERVPVGSAGSGTPASWTAVYVSPSQRSAAVVGGAGSEAEALSEMPLPPFYDVSQEVLERIRVNRDAWRTDSDDVMRSIRTSSPTVDGFVRGGRFSISYLADVATGNWTVFGQSWTLAGEEYHTTFNATIALASPAILDFYECSWERNTADPPSCFIGGGPAWLPLAPLPRIDATGTNLDVGATCNGLNDAACPTFEFNLTRDGEMRANLTWGLPANRFWLCLKAHDMFTCQTEISGDGRTTATSAEMGYLLEAGTYHLVVIPMATPAPDIWTLEARFRDINPAFIRA